MNKIVERIERDLGIPDLVDALVERLSPTDLQSLLLEIYRQRAKKLRPPEILSAYKGDRFVQPAAISPQQLLEWELNTYSVLPAQFETVTLSPVCPFGTSSVLASVDQNWVVSTIRNNEVVSDATNVLALECALRRRKRLLHSPKSDTSVHLATNHRLVRAQHFDQPGLFSHFSLFALCSAGRSRGGLKFELSAFALHIGFYLKALTSYSNLSLTTRLTIIDYSSGGNLALIEAELLSPLQEQFGDIDLKYDDKTTSGQGYYRDLRFNIHARTTSGQWLHLVDGGSVGWTADILSDRKERLVTSGIGSERVCMHFR